MRWNCLLLPVLLLAAAPAAAQDASAAPPPAQIGDIAWLAGRWEGPGIGGAPAVESWLAPIGNAMVGTFVQADGAGGIMFSEHMHLVEHEGSLELRIKHFNADLTGWEAAADMARFPLQSLAHCDAQFAGMRISCEGENGLLIAVQVAENGEVGELLFHLARAD